MIWDWIIAGYLFLAGLGAGAFALASMARLSACGETRKIQMIGYVIAPVAVGAGCLLLVVDARAGLADPLRFFGLLGNLSSVMAWGVIILIAFSAVAVAVLIFSLLKKNVPKPLSVVGLVLAVAVAAYTGLLLGDAPGFPLWNPYILPVLFVVSAASTGFAAVLITARVLKVKEARALPWVHKAGLVLPVVEILCIVALLVASWAATGSNAAAATASVENLLRGSYSPVFWIGLVIVGLALPFSIELSRLGRPERSDSVGSSLAVTGEAGVLVGGYLLRFLIVMAAVPVALG